MNDGPHLPQAGVADYKRLLQAVIEQRPSGTRQRLATALGTTRSFISQIANPLYPLPVPGQHLETIFEVCRFSQADRAAFLDAYAQAHPGKLADPRTRTLSISLPDLGDPALNRIIDAAMAEIVQRLTRLAQDLRDQTPPDMSGDTP